MSITLKELEECVAFAKEHGVSEHKTITLTYNILYGLGSSLGIAAEWNDEPKDITNVDSF